MRLFTLGYRYDPLNVLGQVGAVGSEAGIRGFVVGELTFSVVRISGIRFTESATE